MVEQVAIEFVIGLSLVALGIGGLLGYYIKGRDGTNREKIAHLEAELESSQNELENYRQEVVQQFTDTAEKFKTLDESYHALHRQLATSAVALCGDQGTPLLAASTATAIEAEDVGESNDEKHAEEIVVTEALEEELAADDEELVEDPVLEEVAVVSESDVATDSRNSSEVEPMSSVTDVQEPTLETQSAEVPTLTDSADVDADHAKETKSTEERTSEERSAEERKILP